MSQDKSKYRKKPVVIEAIMWTGDNWDELEKWCPYGLSCTNGRDIVVDTSEGKMTAKLYDWIIKGVKGELYPCKPDIFEMTYEPAD